MIPELKKETSRINIFYSVTVAIYFVSVSLGALNIVGFGSFLRYIAILPLFSWLLFSKKITLNKIFLIQSTLAVLFLISVLYSIEPDTSLSRAVSNISFAILFPVILGLSQSKQNEKIIINSIKWGSRITVIFVFIFGTYLGASGRISLGGVFAEDPNYLTGYFLFGYVFAFSNILKSKKVVSILFSVLEVSVYTYVILATGSRTGFLTYTIVSLMIFLFYNKFKVSKIFTLVIIVLLYWAVFDVASGLIDYSVLQRFSLESILESRGTNRIDIWENAFEIFNQSTVFRKFFGWGAGTMVAANIRFGYIPAAAHNIFIDILIGNGIIGLMVYIFFIYKLCIVSWKMSDKRYFFVLLGMIIISTAASLSAFKPYWNIILAIVYFQTKNVTSLQQNIKGGTSNESSNYS